jgi:hypothetical protein
MSGAIIPGQIGIVVLAQANNPTVLNPDFLRENGIVEASWDWKISEDPITTPAMSRVAYDSGISVVAHPDRIMFADNSVQGIPDDSMIGRVATKYVQTMIHADYRGIGINPWCHFEVADQAQADRFNLCMVLREGKWSRYHGGPVRGSAMVEFSVRNARLMVTVEGAVFGAAGAPKPTPCVLFRGNFHRNLSGTSTSERASELIKILSGWQDDCKEFYSLAQLFLPEDSDWWM